MATMTFADWLAETKGDMTGSALAKAVGTSQSQVSRWLTGQGYPADKALPALAEALGVSGEQVVQAKADYGLAIPTPSPAKKRTPKVRTSSRSHPPAMEDDTSALRDAAIAQLAELALSNANGDYLDRLSKVGELVALARA